MHANATPPLLRLVVTGERLRGKYRVMLDGRTVWLTPGLFLTLCRLARARYLTQTGYCHEAPLRIFRLRDALAGDLEGEADVYIQTGHGHEYRLTPPASEIGIASSFWEISGSLALPFHDFNPSAALATLQGNAAILSGASIEQTSISPRFPYDFTCT